MSRLLAVLVLLLVGMVVSAAPPPTPAREKRARRLHREAIVIDTHNDVTSAIVEKGFDLGMDGARPDAKIRTHTDLRRMRAGGLDAEFFAIYVDPDFVGKTPAQGGGPARRALDMIDAVYEQIRRHPETLELATSAADIRRIAARGKIAALMGLEGGHAIEDSLGALRMFYRLGVRYMTLTHWNSNDWADSAGDLDDGTVHHHGGLTKFGRQVIAEMNRLGMMIDVSHVADRTFFDVIQASRAPIIASHSSARALANHPRNLSDEMLRAVKQNGGVVMVNFFDGFLDPRKVPLLEQASALRRALARKLPQDPARVNAQVRKWWAAHNPGPTPLSVLVDHIDHIVKVAGIDHVGIGSDFDGFGLTMAPAGLEDVAALPNLTIELVRRGYADRDVKKILGGNLLRVMRAVERLAAAPPTP